eukprot:5741189-Prymnesium_polylepis.1
MSLSKIVPTPSDHEESTALALPCSIWLAGAAPRADRHHRPTQTRRGARAARTSRTMMGPAPSPPNRTPRRLTRRPPAPAPSALGAASGSTDTCPVPSTATDSGTRRRTCGHTASWLLSNRGHQSR